MFGWYYLTASLLNIFASPVQYIVIVKPSNGYSIVFSIMFDGILEMDGAPLAVPETEVAGFIVFVL